MRKPKNACIAQTDHVVGEVPVWSQDEQALYWIDVFKPAIHRWNAADGAVQTWVPPERLDALALTGDRRLLVALWSGLARLAPETGQFTLVACPEADRPQNILNEGRDRKSVV